MKVIKILKLNIKKNYLMSPLLFAVFVLNISVCFLMLIIVNDSFWVSQESYVSSQVETRSIEVVFNNAISSDSIKTLLEQMDYHADYIMLFRKTKDTSLGIISMCTFVEKNKNPYRYIYSNITKEALEKEPQKQEAYLSFLITTRQNGKDLLYKNTVTIDDREFMIGDICALSVSDADLTIPYDRFMEFDSTDKMIIVLNALSADKTYQKIIEKIKSIYPDSESVIHRELSELSAESYKGSLIFTFILLCACVVNYFGIFKYMYLKRSKDFNIMRLYGMNFPQLAVLLFLEFIIYNILALCIAIPEFAVFSIIQNSQAVDMLTRFYHALPIIGGFIFVNIIIGLIRTIFLFKKNPVSYKSR